MSGASFAASLLAALAGCSTEPLFVDTPGSVLAPSLAGCTWTADTAQDGLVPQSSQAWTYDLDGRLRTYERTFGDVLGDTTRYDWRGGCLAQVRTDVFGARYGAGDGPPVDQCACDAHESPVRCVHGPIDDGEVVPDAVRTFTNTYDTADNLSAVIEYDGLMVERGAPSERALLSTEAFTWSSSGQPVQLEREDRGDVVDINSTVTWLWDHELLLEVVREGTGVDVTTSRTYDRRRLVAETELHDDVPVVTTRWTYYDDSDPFPSSVEVEDSRYESDTTTQSRITVSCP